MSQERCCTWTQARTTANGSAGMDSDTSDHGDRLEEKTEVIERIQRLRTLTVELKAARAIRRYRTVKSGGREAQCAGELKMELGE